MFIGMMIRFEVLARLGRSEQLIRELKDVYLQELRDGSGTLFENVHALSGCHAFNGEAGALIVNQVLGLGQPLQLTKTVTICPASGSPSLGRRNGGNRGRNHFHGLEQRTG